MIEAQSKKKICWNCEADVSRSAVNCPYCAVYLHPEEDHSVDEEDLSPPYRIDTGYQEEEEDPPYAQKEFSSITKKTKKKERAFFELSGWKATALPALTLLSGSMFLFFGLLLFLFSEEGVLKIKWNAGLWPYYLILALPLLFIGWKSLDHLPEESP